MANLFILSDAMLEGFPRVDYLPLPSASSQLD